MATIEPFERPGVSGFMHRPKTPKAAMLLSHGAGGDSQGALMIAVAQAFCEDGYAVLRWNLPFRQLRPRGAPGGSGERDRDGIRQAVKILRQEIAGVPLYLAGQSYGGRQSSMVAAEDHGLADGLLLLSYPLHPPGNPARLRVEHFPALKTAALFVHGTRDPFGSVDEMKAAIQSIPGRVRLEIVEGAAHGVPPATARLMPAWFNPAVTQSRVVQ
jgi:uncharacterized protein